MSSADNDTYPKDAHASHVLTWDELLNRCSRLHTTRTKPRGPHYPGEVREASRPLDVWIDGQEGQVVPTRMHEPGFYYWLEGAAMRSDVHLAMLKMYADDGKVTER